MSTATASPLIRGYEVVIGLETHAQLSTASKIFSGSSTQFGAAPNTQASPVDLALPGTLPVMNRGAVERAIQFGLAVGAKVAQHSIFARKNYFYPDLPKGYQISQYETPVVQGGEIEFFIGDAAHKVRLTRAHLEEDAGKSLHEDYAGQTGIDLNRAGTPLLEIVSEPDMRSSAEAAEYAKTLHALVVWLGICDGNMQEGSFRCDANVSVRKPGMPYGTRREIKNLNSFKFLQQAIDCEIQWQIDLIEDGGAVQQATVLFNPTANGGRGETRAMRTKEDAHDYRYFPDPDLPPLVIAPEWIERVRGEMPELPRAMAERFQRDYGLPAYDALAVTQSKAHAAFFEAATALCQAPKLVANWMMGELARRLNAEALSIEASPVSAAVIAQLVARIGDGTISNNGAKQVLEPLWAAGQRREPPQSVDASFVDKTIDDLGLRQLSDTGELERLVDEVLAANARSVEEYRAGKEKAFNALVGQAMKATKGKANPAQVTELLKKKLG
ncbi:MAG: Asp-tRNA(Asn)/Glu-tRNA(Gln) amidotransferase subunit GatB [Burkholderiaceae bacterium]|nr:Asp-tRNA(Asn)/Glu-tRNA(Gln) amidotransferase subunit GatB [Burkholderiaceae bacterium]